MKKSTILLFIIFSFFIQLNSFSFSNIAKAEDSIFTLKNAGILALIATAGYGLFYTADKYIFNSDDSNKEPQSDTAFVTDFGITIDCIAEGYNQTLTIPKTKRILIPRTDGSRYFQDRFLFEKPGPEYGASFLLIFGDGNRFKIKNSEHDTIKAAYPDATRYNPSGEERGTASVNAKYETHPKTLTMCYNQ